MNAARRQAALAVRELSIKKRIVKQQETKPTDHMREHHDIRYVNYITLQWSHTQMNIALKIWVRLNLGMWT